MNDHNLLLSILAVLRTHTDYLEYIATTLSGEDYRKSLETLRLQLKHATDGLESAVKSNQPQPKNVKELSMANPILQQLEAQVSATVGVAQSATVLINGFAQRLADTVAAALAGGATAAELAAAVNADIAALKASSADLSAAVVANTPPPQPVGP